MYNLLFSLPFGCLTSQTFLCKADKTPCTILYTIRDQKVDVGKATIMELKEPLFHSRPPRGPIVSPH